jgi:hypothetical protein
MVINKIRMFGQNKKYGCCTQQEIPSAYKLTASSFLDALKRGMSKMPTS